MPAKSSQNRDAIEMTRRDGFSKKLQSSGAIHSSDSSNGDASQNKIHEYDATTANPQGELGSIKTPGPLDAGARRRLGTRLVAIRAAAPKISSHGSR